VRSEREFLVDVLGRLNAAGVDYMLTGSMASNYWGIPRTTHDLDFVLLMTPDQTGAMVSAFDAGFFLQPESVRAAFQPPFQFNVLDEQSALKADFWLLREDAFEQTAFERRMPVVLFGAFTGTRSRRPGGSLAMPRESTQSGPTRLTFTTFGTGRRNWTSKANSTI
jgi:hypothetical protein